MEERARTKNKTLLFILELSFVFVLLALWVSIPGLRESKSLWVLFFYSFPAEFIISTVPHEPVLLYYAKFYKPLTIALVAIAGTGLTEILNYSVFKYVADSNLIKNVRKEKIVGKVVVLFNKAPFAALLIAGFTPIPFYPFRFLVVLARYPLTKYILAILIARPPRFFLLAWLGYAYKIPDSLLIALFIVLAVSVNYSLIKNWLKSRKERNADAS
jgi:membrane protein YqaA with SNARE-associated domain